MLCVSLSDLREALCALVLSSVKEKWGDVRTPNEERSVSTSVLFTRGILVSAVRRSASGVLSTRSRISVGGRCSDCLYAVRYWPASSALGKARKMLF